MTDSPVVHRLLPTEELSQDHHGPLPRSPTGYIALPDGADVLKPKYFRNPWKSWRSPSLWDAYTAYQKGAAIALPLHRTARSASHLATKINATVMGAHEDHDHGEHDAGVPHAEGEERDPRGADGATRETKLYPIPSRTYIRPDLSLVHPDDDEDDWCEPPLEVVNPTWESLGEVDVTWLGHASTLVRIPWTRPGRREAACGVLFDPIFSYRCSPSQYVGPARYLNPPCSVSELPPIHIVCISHDHYDHLDYYTIIDLWKHHESTIHFFVPFGLAQWFTSSGVPENRVTELDWWHETILLFPLPPSSVPASPSPRPSIGQGVALNLKLIFTPSQHRSGRGVMDHMTTLWGSWCIGVVGTEDEGKAEDRGMRDWKGFKLYFGGDTGYRYATAGDDDPDAICPAFQQIADLYGPVTLSLLPISTGSSLPFLRNVLSLSLDQYTLTSSQHCSPGDALEIHRIMGSQRTLGIHWGTFCDAQETRGTKIELGRERRKRGVGRRWEQGANGGGAKGSFATSKIGETLVVPA